MKTIFGLTLKAAVRDPFLLFWSIILPIGGTVSLGLFIKQPGYPLRIMIGMMAAGVLFYAFTTTAFAILSQRRRGVYNLLHVTPMPLWEYICSVSGAWTLVSLLCSMLVLVVGILTFKLGIIAVSILMLLPIVLVAAIGYVLLSFFVSSLCKTEAHASIVTNIVAMPLLFCSDAFYGLEKAPVWLRTITHLNPFQWFVNGLRSSLSQDMSAWLVSMGLLLLILAITLILAVRTFKFADA